MEESRQSGPKIIKSITLAGDRAKTISTILEFKKHQGEFILIIDKLILSNHPIEGFEMLKEFKGMYLCKQHVSIKLSTFEEIFRWVYGE